MSKMFFERLSALDNSFLVFEKPHIPMHIGSTMIFEAGELAHPDGGIDVDAVRDAVRAALPFIPRYRQKIVQVPGSYRWVWVDDSHFNIDYHIRHTALPRPGGDEELKRLAGRIMESHLDRSRPLWEMWVVEGMDDGRFAIISKVHHCMIDGVAGVDLMTVLLDVDRESKRPQPGAFIPRRVPTAWELLADGVSHRAMLPLRLLKGASALFKEADDTKRDLLVRLRALAGMLGWTVASADDIPFNREVGPHRRADWYAMDLARVKAVRARLGGSINDIVLTVVAGAVQRMLSKRRINPGSVDFRVLAPVSVRGNDERGRPGNRVSAWLIDLPVDRVDPRAQLDLVREQTRELKESRQAVGAELLTDVAEWAPSTLLALGTRNVTRMRLFDMIVTNVPGPQFPVYMAGARLLETYPVVPLFDNMGLGIALLSYDGAIYWGMNADYDLFPDTSEAVDAIDESFAALEAAAQAASDELTSSGGEVNIQPPAGHKSSEAGVGEASPAQAAAADSTGEQVSPSQGEPPDKVTLN